MIQKQTVNTTFTLAPFNNDGTPKKTMECIKCENGYTPFEHSKCIPCHESFPPDKSCVCPELTHSLLNGVCLQNSNLKDPSIDRKAFYEIQYENIRLESTLYREHVAPAFYLCKVLIYYYTF